LIKPRGLGIRSWDCDMTEITGNAQGNSWYTTLKTLNVGKTKLATRWSYAIPTWHGPHFSSFALCFSAFTINKPGGLWHTFPPWKMLIFLNLFIAMSLRASMKLQATTKWIQNTEFILNFILLIFRNIAYIRKHPTWDFFEKLWFWMTQSCPHLALTLVVSKMFKSNK